MTETQVLLAKLNAAEDAAGVTRTRPQGTSLNVIKVRLNALERPVRSDIPHTEFNRRFETLTADYSEAQFNTEKFAAWGPTMAQEAYTLLQELPPASNRATLLRDMLKVLKQVHGVEPKLVAASDSAGVKKLVWRDPKLPKAHQASRGRTIKATPKQLAEGKVLALTAQLSNYDSAIDELNQKIGALKVDREASEAKLKAAQAALKGFRGGKRGPEPTEKAPSAKPKTAPKATPKGELSDAMKDTLKFIHTGKGLAKTGLSLAQVSAARMHLAMRGLVAKQSDGTYKLTPTGKEALKAIK